MKHAQFFVEVARLRHFGEAADHLGMTQPPLSQGIQRLEKRWDCRLLDRSSRGVELTQSGRTLLPLAQRFIQAGVDLEDAARLIAAQSERLSVVLSPEASVFIGPTLTLIREDAGLPDLDVEFGSSEHGIGRLSAGLADVALIRYPCVVSTGSALDIYQINSYLCMSESLDQGTWIDMPLAVSARAGHPAAHDQLVDALARLGWQGKVRETQSTHEAEALVVGGMAIAPLLVQSVDHLPEGATPIPVIGNAIPLRFVLIWTSARASDAEIRQRTRELFAQGIAQWHEVTEEARPGRTRT